MLILDLRWVLFAGLLLLIGAVWLAGPRRLPPRRPVSRNRAAPEWDLLSRALDQIPFALLVLERPGGYRYANQAARRLLGLAAPAGRLPEAAWTELLETDRQAAREARNRGTQYRVVPLPVGPPGRPVAPPPADEEHRLVRWWVTAFEDGDLVWIEDITSHQQAEEAARSLINTLSHELRTPLATILTHLEVLSLATLSPELRQQSVHLLKAEARRMVRLVQQLLELSRLETSLAIERRPIDLLALVEDTLAQVVPLAEERGIILSLEADPPLPLVAGDGDRLRQVFLNLLDNAVKYCRPGDRVIVALRQEPDGIQCVVRDTGPGIPAACLPHLTRRFYRAAAPPDRAGSGLGLALVEEILRRHQSDLEVVSQTEGDETGTLVRFRLPVESRSAPAPAARVQA